MTIATLRPRRNHPAPVRSCGRYLRADSQASPATVRWIPSSTPRARPLARNPANSDTRSEIACIAPICRAIPAETVAQLYGHSGKVLVRDALIFSSSNEESLSVITTRTSDSSTASVDALSRTRNVFGMPPWVISKGITARSQSRLFRPRWGPAQGY